jgi:hypothetical protein
MPNPIISAALATQLSTLERVYTPDTSEALGYGRDLSCVDDLAPDFGDVDPQSTRAIAEALARRLMTPRGTLLDDPTYGLDLRQYLNTGLVLPNGVADVSIAVRGECRKDDRVDDLTVTVDYTLATRVMQIALTVTPVDVALGVFTFTLVLDAAGVVTLGFGNG